jgi:hypothetical protein
MVYNHAAAIKQADRQTALCKLCSKIIPVFFLTASIVLVVIGSYYFNFNTKFNNRLSGSCTKAATEGDCLVECVYAKVSTKDGMYLIANASFVADCGKNYKLDLAVNPVIPKTLKPVNGFLAMLIVGAVILGLIAVIGLVFCCMLCLCGGLLSCGTITAFFGLELADKVIEGEN